MIELSEIQNGTGGFVVNGVPTDNIQGVKVSNAGDLNGDGRDDFIIGARTADPNGAAPGGSYAGEAYVVFGQAGTTNLEISDIRAGIGGFVIQGAGVGHQAGWSVSAAGDVNDDGTPDLIVGARNAAPNGTDSGSAYVVYGKSDGMAVDLSDVESGTGGFVINGAAAGDLAGYSVSDAGDVNGDGYADVIVGAIFADPNGFPGDAAWDSGASYVVFGKADGTAVELSDVASGTGGFVINGDSSRDYSGRAVSSAGDVNGDGLDDLLVGASHDDPNGVNSGQALVVYGKADGTAVDLSDVESGTGGFAIVGAETGGQAGYSVSSAGDVNGDGVGDLIVGAPAAGAAYVVFGPASGVWGGTAVDLAEIEAGDGGFVIDGQGVGGLVGHSVSAAGDLNGDGLADLVVGGPGGYFPEAYVVYGKGTTTAVELQAVVLHNQGGIALAGGSFTDIELGYSVTGSGDVNGDGLDDIVLAAVGDDFDGPEQGAAVVVFGEDSYGQPVQLSELNFENDGVFGIRGAEAGDLAGWSVSGAGDVNGDGYADLIVGAPHASPTSGQETGAAYVVFGKTDRFQVSLDTIESGAGGFVIEGADTGDATGYAVSNAGDVNGDGLADLIVGSPGAGSDGTVHVVFGKADGTAIDLSDVSSGTGGFLIDIGTQPALGFGRSVSDAGDVNGDGLADLIVDARDSEGVSAYVVFGKADGTAVGLSDVVGGTGGFAINNDLSHDDYTPSQSSVSTAGDVNGDGYADLIVGLPWDGPDGPGYGTSYVVFGKAGGAAVDLSDIESGTGGFTIGGISQWDAAGYSVSDAGDVNGDGLADLIVGATDAGGLGAEAGEAYVVFGKADGTAVDLADVKAGTGGFAIVGAQADDFLGHSISTAGDVNGDGLADLIVSGWSSDAAYVVYGKSDGTAVDLSDVAAGDGGFVINGPDTGDYSGIGEVSAAGDVNNDGADDLIVGVPTADDSGAVDIGRAYVVFGTLDTDSDNVLRDGADDNERFGYLGDDTLYGGGGSDTLYGGVGEDVLHGEADDDLLVGNFGADVFVFTSDGGEDTVLDFSVAQGDVIEVEAGLNGTGIASVGDLLARLGDDGAGNAELDLGAGNLVKLMGVDYTTLGASEFALF